MSQTVIAVDPFRCRLWPLHARLSEGISAASCKTEIQSFIEHGQMMPVLGRPLHADPQHEIEIIYGARRWFAARLLKQPLQVELRELDDRQAIIAMDAENRLRLDLSPYERGLGLTRWLHSGHFQSQEEMARALQVSVTQISRLLKLARLPSIVVGAFGSGTQIRETWGLELMDALNDPARRQSLLRVARAISTRKPRPTPSQTFSKLLTAGMGATHYQARNASRPVVVKNAEGAPLFRVIRQSHSMTYQLPRERLSPQVLRNIEQAVARILTSRLQSNTTKPPHPLLASHAATG